MDTRGREARHSTTKWGSFQDGSAPEKRQGRHVCHSLTRKSHHCARGQEEAPDRASWPMTLLGSLPSSRMSLCRNASSTGGRKAGWPEAGTRIQPGPGSSRCKGRGDGGGKLPGQVLQLQLMPAAVAARLHPPVKMRLLTRTAARWPRPGSMSTHRQRLASVAPTSRSWTVPGWCSYRESTQNLQLPGPAHPSWPLLQMSQGNAARCEGLHWG